jgi:hypothetical protein
LLIINSNTRNILSIGNTDLCTVAVDHIRPEETQVVSTEDEEGSIQARLEEVVLETNGGCCKLYCRLATCPRLLSSKLKINSMMNTSQIHYGRLQYRLGC